MDLIRQTTRIYLQESWQHKWQFVSLWLMLPFPVLAGSIALPIFYGAIIDRLSQFATGDAITRHEALTLFWWYVVFEGIHFFMWRIIDRVMLHLQPKVMKQLERKVFAWLLELSYTFHVNSFGGSLVARGRRFVNSYERLFDIFYFDVAPLAIRIIAVMIVLFIKAPIIALILLIWILLFMLSQSYLTIKKMPLSRSEAKAESAVTANLADTITNITSVKSFGRNDFEKSKFAKTTQHHYARRLISWKRDWTIRTYQAIAMTLASLLILYLSIDLLFKGAITIGTIVLIGLYVRRAFDDLWGFGRTLQRVERSFSDAAEMTRTFSREIEVKDPLKPDRSHITKGRIVMHDVGFRYQDSASEDTLFDKFNLTIEPGTKVGLVGPSGGGKTTITRLLLRLYDPMRGTVEIDGQDISLLSQAELRQGIAYVPQEPVLFHRSLADNIRYGQTNASEREIHKAAKDAHADLFIEKLPKTYDTLVGERGTKLSGGEKQRVAIARAMIKNAPILILDEATSALDSDSERLIQDALRKLMEHRTTIVIAHRLSTIQHMDRIIVLDEGTIIEDGTHSELLKLGGLYATLWQHQSGGFIED